MCVSEYFEDRQRSEQKVELTDASIADALSKLGAEGLVEGNVALFKNTLEKLEGMLAECMVGWERNEKTHDVV